MSDEKERKERKPRTEPRISLNKLGEYLVASPRRRRSIINEQKHPKDYIVSRYQLAENAIISCLILKKNCLYNIDKLMKEIECKPDASKWHKENSVLCSQAFLSFLNFFQDIPVFEYTLTQGDPNPKKMNLGGVEVSVRPDILLLDPVNEMVIGGIKLYITKTYPLDDRSGIFVSTVLYRYLAQDELYGSAINNKYCFVVDVFAQKPYQAPKSWKKNMYDIEAACAEMAAVWPTV